MKSDEFIYNHLVPQDILTQFNNQEGISQSFKDKKSNYLYTIEINPKLYKPLIGVKDICHVNLKFPHMNREFRDYKQIQSRVKQIDLRNDKVNSGRKITIIKPLFSHHITIRYGDGVLRSVSPDFDKVPHEGKNSPENRAQRRRLRQASVKQDSSKDEQIKAAENDSRDLEVIELDEHIPDAIPAPTIAIASSVVSSAPAQDILNSVQSIVSSVQTPVVEPPKEEVIPVVAAQEVIVPAVTEKQPSVVSKAASITTPVPAEQEKSVVAAPDNQADIPVVSAVSVASEVSQQELPAGSTVSLKSVRSQKRTSRVSARSQKAQSVSVVANSSVVSAENAPVEKNPEEEKAVSIIAGQTAAVSQTSVPAKAESVAAAADQDKGVIETPVVQAEIPVASTVSTASTSSKKELPAVSTVSSKSARSQKRTSSVSAHSQKAQSVTSSQNAPKSTLSSLLFSRKPSVAGERTSNVSTRKFSRKSSVVSKKSAVIPAASVAESVLSVSSVAETRPASVISLDTNLGPNDSASNISINNKTAISKKVALEEVASEVSRDLSEVSSQSSQNDYLSSIHSARSVPAPKINQADMPAPRVKASSDINGKGINLNIRFQK